MPGRSTVQISAHSSLLFLIMIWYGHYCCRDLSHTSEHTVYQKSGDANQIGSQFKRTRPVAASFCAQRSIWLMFRSDIPWGGRKHEKTKGQPKTTRLLWGELCPALDHLGKLCTLNICPSLSHGCNIIVPLPFCSWEGEGRENGLNAWEINQWWGDFVLPW